MQSSKKIDQLINESRKLAASHSSKYITSEHVLFVMLTDNDLVSTLDNFGINTLQLIEEIQVFVSNKIPKDLVVGEHPVKTHSLDRIFNRAYTGPVQWQRRIAYG